MICEYIKLKSEKRNHFSVSSTHGEVRASSSIFPYKGTMIARNQEVCLVEGKLKSNGFHLYLQFAQGGYEVKIFDSSSNIQTAGSLISMIGKAVKEKSMDAFHEALEPKIYDLSGNQVGELQYISVKKEANRESYYYRKLILNGVEVFVYVVGQGVKGIFFCMYDAFGTMIATVSKQTQIKNGKSRYTFYLLNDAWFPYVALITTILHQLDYEGKEKDGCGLGSRGQALHTFQKGLLEKYNPNFIPAIIQKEEPRNLPENMPLVHEKIKESQTTVGLRLSRVMAVIFALGFGMLLLYLFFIS
jgi:hypothetical protein